MAAPSKTWNIQNYILAALGGTLAATATVIIISAIFSPARITFVVTHASRSNLTDSNGMRLNLTISANTSQHRTKVKYESIFIDLLNSTTGPDKVHAVVDNTTALPKDYVNSSSLTTFNASALLIRTSTTFEGFAGSQVDIRGLTVEVMAQVRFKVGKAPPSRLFGIKVFCRRVHFAEYQQNSTATAALPIGCDG